MVCRHTGAKPAAISSELCWRSGTSRAMASRITMSRLGDARPSSRKLRCRCEMLDRPASSSCDRPLLRRHNRRLAAKSCRCAMSTCQVVAEALPIGKMPQPD